MRHMLPSVAVAILLYASPLLAVERCGYMIAIPREPKPDDLPDISFNGEPWSERPFLPAPEREDLCMDGYFPTSPTTGTQIIFMDEEIDGNVTIAKLNYNGPNVPEIRKPLVTGSFNMLGPAIDKIGGDWYLIITQRQDFETPGMQVYMLEVTIAGESLVAGVTIQIVNIDDNAPIIHVFDHCIIPEMSATGLTSCIYDVMDVDGEISTRQMTFSIESDRDDDRVFYAYGQNIPDEWTWMLVTLGLHTPLNFDTNPLHIFRVTAVDSGSNNHTVTIMVQVQNVEHRPPRWVEIFAVQQFDEKQPQQFTVRAIDGDTGIDKPILYYLETEEEDTFFSIETIGAGREGAILHVGSIDRDALQREIFRLTIVAHKYDNKTFATPANVIIIVNDVNDQKPEPLYDEYHIAIPEETPLTLNFDKEFGFHDRDLGQNAQYSVHLESVSPPGVEKAFYIAPQVGYQRQTFIMGTTNHSMLDYEEPEFQKITIKVVATDLNRTDFVGVATVHIDLINWNDELPIFMQSSKTVNFNETEGMGFFVGTMLATDRDINDKVIHSLLGNAGDYLHIEDDTGNIYVSRDDAFDYHRQSQLFVQIRAVDTLGEPYNDATSQLVIQLNDINNTPPTLRLPRGSPEVEENVPEFYEITSDIRATDPDTTAELRFEIDWSTSYATKQGRQADSSEYHNCVHIETVYPNADQKGVALGKITVREIRRNVTIDFEMFEILYLTIRVVDLQTVIGDTYDELMLAIIIIDMNDNAPVWADGTLEQSLRVRENSASGSIIGSLLAIDIDSELYNQVRYTIVPRNNTPEGLVKIHSITGQLSVDLNEKIDADTPPRHYLYYTAVASDKCSTPPEDCPPDDTYWETEGEIAIHILDTNNKVPHALTEEFDMTVYIYENATAGTEVVQLVSKDLDRDEIYHTVSYQINYAVNPRLRNFFIVDLETGQVLVDFPTDEVLDRDGEEPTHHIFFTLIDNFYSAGGGNRNQNATEVLVVLLDVNDNAPELPNNLSWSILEDYEEGTRVLPYIFAPDRDEPNTDNSRVGYEILNLTVTNRDVELPDLFVMINIDNVTGELETAMPLKGYWGTYTIGIRAYDHGYPQMWSEEVYPLVIRPYNFHDPVFVFPQNGATVRVAREHAIVNGMLMLVNGEFLDRISATDEDGLDAGVVTFEVTGNDEALEYFQMVNIGDNMATLTLKRTFTEDIREFQVVIRGTDGGTEPGSRWTETTLNVVYVPTQGEPEFLQPATVTAAFTEKDQGLQQREQLPLAQDRKNHKCDGDCLNIYYKIIDGNDEGQFAVEATTNVLYLVKELNRTAEATHTLRIAASNIPGSATGLPSSILTVTVNVREAFPRPNFLRSLYTAGISTMDSINRALLTVQATHTENLPIVYKLDQASMVVDPSLEAVRDSAFELHRDTGVLTLTMQPTAAMHGMFEFNVIATDPADEFDTAEVKVFLISEQNRVIFTFVNTVAQVENDREFIAETFGTAFRMTCNIDRVLPASDAAGVAHDNLTEVRAHFIRDDLPVDVEHIEELRSDLLLLRHVQDTLNTRELLLDDLITGGTPDIGNESARITVYVLAALSGILGFLCLVLLLSFVIRTKALKNRLEALLETRYGSQESGLNRAGLAAPGTNKHTTEGSNPIWNEALKAPDFDAISEASDDSDLIGIENLPQFRTDYFPSDDSTSVQDAMSRKDSQIADHSNNFGFNTTPFSPEFANKPFKHSQ